MLEKTMKTLLFCVVLGLSAWISVEAAYAQSGKGEDGTSYRQLEPEVQRLLARAVHGMEIRLDESVWVRITTSDCPARCKGWVTGGMCFCKPDSNGNCPKDTASRPHGVNPPTECSTTSNRASVKTTDMREPLQVQMP